MFLLRVHLVSVSPKWSGLLVRANFLFVSFPLPFVTTRHDTYIVTRSFLCLFFSFLRPLYYANRLNRTTQTKVVCLVLSCLGVEALDLVTRLARIMCDSGRLIYSSVD